MYWWNSRIVFVEEMLVKTQHDWKVFHLQSKEDFEGSCLGAGTERGFLRSMEDQEMLRRNPILNHSRPKHKKIKQENEYLKHGLPTNNDYQSREIPFRSPSYIGGYKKTYFTITTMP